MTIKSTIPLAYQKLCEAEEALQAETAAELLLVSPVTLKAGSNGPVGEPFAPL
jgi:hypothetical protein